MEKVQIKNSLGQNIAAVIHSPKEESDKLAILCPGNLDYKDYPHLIELANRLAENNYTVVRFDPTGTWDSEGSVDQYNVTQYLNDIRSVLNYMLGQKPYSDILLGGHSRGGQLSLLYAARDFRIKKVVAIMPSSQRTIKIEENAQWKELGYKLSKRDIPGSEEIKEYKLPYSSLEDRMKYDVIADVKNIFVPTVYITGENETVVLPHHVKEIFDNANEPKKFINIPGIGHDYRHSAEEIELVNSEILKALDLK
jgi:pimeloyl-ACP methyl ester carboxylesterase